MPHAGEWLEVEMPIDEGVSGWREAVDAQWARRCGDELHSLTAGGRCILFPTLRVWQSVRASGEYIEAAAHTAPSRE